MGYRGPLMRIVVTGATGFLGGHLLPHLVERGDVFAVHRAETRPAQVDGVSWIETDLARDPLDALPDRVDAIFHLAHSRHYRALPDRIRDVFDVNVGATVRLLEYGRRAGCDVFVLASSGGVYRRGPTALSEDAELRAPGAYAASKLAAEAAANAFSALMRVVVLRPFFPYAAGQPDKFLAEMIARVRAGEPIRLGAATGPQLNPVHVDDAVTAFVAALDMPAATTLNVAGPDVVTVRRIAEILGAELGIAPTFSEGPFEENLVGSIERLCAAGLAPTVGIEDGLRSMVAMAGSPV
jgi:nucleoside-diphosphate-sugar epimerase